MLKKQFVLEIAKFEVASSVKHNIMKKIKIKKQISVLFVVVILICACSTKEDDGSGKTDPIPESTSNITFPPNAQLNPVLTQEGGNISLPFTSTGNWNASVSNYRADSWITISPQTGLPGNTILSIKVLPNENTDERSATITLTSGIISKKIVLTQKQKDALIVTSSKIEIENTGGQFKVEVKANIEFNTKTNMNWVHVILTRGLQNKVLSFSADVNESTKNREGEIIISSNDLSEIIKVYQSGEIPGIILTTREYQKSSEGGIIKVEINHNVDYQIKALETYNWIDEVKSRSYSTHTCYYNISPNNTHDVRKAKLVFVNKEEIASDTLVIVQSGKEIERLILSPTSFNLSADEKTILVNVDTNINYGVTFSDNWISWSEGSTISNNSNLTFIISKNEKTISRTGTITFLGENIKQTVTIVQKGDVERLIISPTSFNLPADEKTISVNVDSNIDYEVAFSDNWISWSEGSKKSNNSNPTFIISKNEKTISRTGTITFSGRNIKQTVTIIQEGKKITGGIEDFEETEQGW